MLHPAPLACPPRTGLTGRLGPVSALLALLVLMPARAAAADRPVEGLIVDIPPTVTTESKNRLRSLLHGPLKRFEQSAARQGGRFVLVCDFNPDGRRADCDDADACHGLARYLRSLQTDHQGVRTVAYVHAEVRRHSVLPVLACSEIAFSERGRLGPVAGPGKSLGEVETTAYKVITRNRFSEALIRKLYDPDVEVVRVGNDFVDAAQAKGQGKPVPGLAAGEVASYGFEQARELGLCQQLPSGSLDELRVAAGLPRPDATRVLDRSVCWRIPVHGPITGGTVEQTRRRVERALRARADTIIFELACAGGDHEQAAELGRYIASLNERPSDPPVQTIAFVTNKARNLAVFLALACDQIILQREDDGDNKDAAADDDEDAMSREARLGGLGTYLRRHPSLEPIRKELAELSSKAAGARVAELKKQLADGTGALEAALEQELTRLAKKQMYPAVLAAGMCNPHLRIHVVERALGAGGRAFLSEEDFRADQAGPKQWRSVGLVKPWHGQERFADRHLTLTARQAEEVGLAAGVVKDVNDLYEFEGVSPKKVRTAEADWLDGLADFLRDPVTSVILVMVGVTCLILELKMPGVGLPGVLSAICFVLFFWAHSQLNGQITWLAILLFVLGLVLIGLEVFVLPGLGVCGISGILLVLASLGLVAFGRWPQTSSEWAGLGNTIAPFGISLLGSLLCVVLIVRYLPHIPVLNRLMHRPEDGDGGDTMLDHPLHAEMQALLGAIGVAATPLRPAGKTQFGDNFVDVVAEGGYVMPGTRVQVIEVEGNRVVVKEV